MIIPFCSIGFLVVFGLLNAVGAILNQEFQGTALDEWIKHLLKLCDLGDSALIPVYFAFLCLAFGFYGGILSGCKAGKSIHPGRYPLLFAVPVLLHLGLVFLPPEHSIDVFSYLGHGYLANNSKEGPYGIAVSSLGNTSYGHELKALGWRTVHGKSPYGPLWTFFERAVVTETGNHVLWGMFLMKFLVVIASLGSAILIWKSCELIASPSKLFCTMAYLWNPFVLLELARDGHNDSLEIFFTLAAGYYFLSRSKASGALAMFMGILVKYVPLTFAPALLFHGWRAGGMQGCLSILAAFLVGLLIAAGLYFPYWHGLETFDGVRAGAAGLSIVGWQVLNTLAKIGVHASEQACHILVVVLFAAFVALRSVQVTDARSLIHSCADICCFYFLFVSSSFWPWYFCFPFALYLVAPDGYTFAFALGGSFLATLVSPLDHLVVHRLMEESLAKGIQVILFPWAMAVAFLSLLARQQWAAWRRAD